VHTALSLAALVSARRVGDRTWLGDCPVCHYPDAFSVRELDGKTLFKCHVGCEQSAVIQAIGYGPTLRRLPVSTHLACRRGPAGQRSALLSATACRLWAEAIPAPGTLVEAYLRARGIACPPPATIRFLSNARHSPTGTSWPCMLAAVARSPDNKVVAVHRTFLGVGPHKAKIEPCRMTLGLVAGGAVRFAPAGDVVGVAEGIETALSAMQLSGVAVWAALSAGGIERLILPAMPQARTVIVFADHDRRGIDAAEYAAARWRGEGREVRIELPTKPGTDFNDALARQIERVG
jgi:putative DNA primase/helicase